MSASSNNSSFWDRLTSNDTARKGLASAVAGILVAAVTEIVWPAKT